MLIKIVPSIGVPPPKHQIMSQQCLGLPIQSIMFLFPSHKEHLRNSRWNLPTALMRQVRLSAFRVLNEDIGLISGQVADGVNHKKSDKQHRYKHKPV